MLTYIAAAAAVACLDSGKHPEMNDDPLILWGDVLDHRKGDPVSIK